MATETAATAQADRPDDAGSGSAASGNAGAAEDTTTRSGSGRFAGLAPFQSRAYRYLFVGTDKEPANHLTLLAAL